jgi:hypothetical protein
MENYEEIPEVNENVAIEAGKIVTFALLNDIKIEIDYDVLGGVAIYLSNFYNDSIYNNDKDEKQIWISLLNNGTKTVLDLNNKKLLSSVIDYDMIISFLFNE